MVRDGWIDRDVGACRRDGLRHVAGVVGDEVCERLWTQLVGGAVWRGALDSVLNRPCPTSITFPLLPPFLPAHTRHRPAPSARRRQWRPRSTMYVPLSLAVALPALIVPTRAQHKHLQPAGAATQGPSLQAHHASVARLNDAFEAIRQEYDQLIRELEQIRAQRDDFESKRQSLPRSITCRLTCHFPFQSLGK